MQLRTWATPLTAGAFVLVAVTGLLMFFELGDIGFVKPAHEFLSLAFVFGALAHVIVHFKALKNHLKSKMGRVLIGAFIAMTIVVLLPLAPQEQKPHFPALQVRVMLMESSLQTLAQVTQLPLSEVLIDLSQAGLSNPDSTKSLAEQAKAQNLEPQKLLGLLLQNSKVPAPEED